MVQAIPTSTPTASITADDRKLLTDHSSILTSQAGLLTSICDTQQQLRTTSKTQPPQTLSPAVADGEKRTAADKPSSSSIVPSPIVNIEEEGDDDEEDENTDLQEDEPSSSRKDGGDDDDNDDDDDDDRPSLLSRKAVQTQGAPKSSVGGAAESSQPQGEKPPPEKTQSGTQQPLNPSTSSSPDSDQQPIATLLSKPSTSTQTLQTKEPQKMDFSSSGELPYEEPSLSPIHQEPICRVPLTIYPTEIMEAEPSPSPTPHQNHQKLPNLTLKPKILCLKVLLRI